MTKSLNTSSVVSCSKDRKCKKPCKSSSSSSCCTEQCLDCCSSQYQRLSRFASFVTDNQIRHAGDTAANAWDVKQNEAGTTAGATAGAIFNRCGALVPHAGNTTAPTSTTAGDAYANETGCSGSEPNTPQDLTVAGFQVALAGYQFVNEFAYGPYEPGCHNDQVYGWYTDLSSGELQLFTQMDGVPTNATRACLSADLSSTLTSTQKRQLKVLNKLYKLSKSAVKEVNGIPSQEGNIVEVCDCKGEKWLLYINTADAQNNSPLSSCNYQFAVVATKLC